MAFRVRFPPPPPKFQSCQAATVIVWKSDAEGFWPFFQLVRFCIFTNRFLFGKWDGIRMQGSVKQKSNKNPWLSDLFSIPNRAWEIRCVSWAWFLCLLDLFIPVRFMEESTRPWFPGFFWRMKVYGRARFCPFKMGENLTVLCSAN